ncbi:MAG: hypothetical protein WD960_15070 [Gemmatimonadota bacterium]
MNRWLPSPPDLGPFRFRTGEGATGGAAHLPGEPGRIAFLAPGQPLPEGWEWGRPPPMTPEEWSRWAGEVDRERSVPPRH